MRIFSALIVVFCTFNIWAQDDIYFLVNERDTLIRTHISKEPNTYAGYEILYDQLILVKKNRTPGPSYKKISSNLIEVKEEDPLYDYFVYEHPSVSFSFLKENDQLISKDDLQGKNVITERSKFLDIGSGGGFDNGNFYFFLEKRENGKYLIREVYPVIFE